MRLNVLCLWYKHEILYIQIYAPCSIETVLHASCIIHISYQQQLSRAYWTNWIVCANLYSCATRLLFFLLIRLTLFLSPLSACVVDSSIHNKVQIILWDLCLSIASFFIVRALCHCCCCCCWYYFFQFSVFLFILLIPLRHSHFIIHSIADNQHRHMHNSCASVYSRISHSISPG